jgi:hypothetical protein
LSWNYSIIDMAGKAGGARKAGMATKFGSAKGGKARLAGKDGPAHATPFHVDVLIHLLLNTCFCGAVFFRAFLALPALLLTAI